MRRQNAKCGAEEHTVPGLCYGRAFYVRIKYMGDGVEDAPICKTEYIWAAAA